MQYRLMGAGALKLSVIGLGSWYTLGTSVDEDESIRIIRTAHEEGINFFDTANAYTREWGSGEGDVERLLGRALRELPRSSYMVMDKLGGRMGAGPNEVGRSAKYLYEQCELSLKRLGLDHIDILMCHRPSPDLPVEETVRVMEDLARRGMILYWGVSNWAGWRIVKAQAIARQIGARPMTVCQPRYNLLFRYPELELFPATADEGVGHVVFSPLAQGMLTGKYRPGQPPPSQSRGADEHDGKYMRMLYLDEQNKQRCHALAELAAEAGITAAQLAIAWTLRHGQVTAAITGARNAQQVRHNAGAARVRLDDDLAARVEQLFPLRRDLWLAEGEIPRLIAPGQEQAP